MIARLCAVIVLACVALPSFAADQSDIAGRIKQLEDELQALKQELANIQSTQKDQASKQKQSSWVENLQISGYVQGRWEQASADEYSETAPSSVQSSSTKVGSESSNLFHIRRARLKLKSKMNDNLTVQFQTDSHAGLKSPSSDGGDVQLIDAWAQYDLNPEDTWRLRFGAQEVPFGFEAPQSSSSRMPLERSNILRWSVPGERDYGLWAFYTTPEHQKLFSDLKKMGGTGDFGTLSFGVYNGEGRYEDEKNSNKHVSARLAVPFVVTAREVEGAQQDMLAEAGLSYYTGKRGEDSRDDDLFGAHFFLPPQPFGFQAEYYTGTSNDEDVDGWYGMASYQLNDETAAFARYDEFKGNRKEKNKFYDVDRFTVGVAHELDKNLEVTVEYSNEDHSFVSGDTKEKIDNLGLQVQYKF